VVGKKKGIRERGRLVWGETKDYPRREESPGGVHLGKGDDVESHQNHNSKR